MGTNYKGTEVYEALCSLAEDAEDDYNTLVEDYGSVGPGEQLWLLTELDQAHQEMMAAKIAKEAVEDVDSN